MQLFAVFEYSPYLELAISELKEKGVTDIYAVPLELQKETPRLMDTMHRADGMSFADKGFILAFLFATVGASKGFVWHLGPVIWGLIGAAAGFLLGVLINYCQFAFKRRKRRLSNQASGAKGNVILIVSCEEGQAAMVKDILWDHLATGVAVTK